MDDNIIPSGEFLKGIVLWEGQVEFSQEVVVVERTVGDLSQVDLQNIQHVLRDITTLFQILV